MTSFKIGDTPITTLTITFPKASHDNAGMIQADAVGMDGTTTRAIWYVRTWKELQAVLSVHINEEV